MPMITRAPSNETLNTLFYRSPDAANLASTPQSANLPRLNSNASQSTTASNYTGRGRVGSDAPLMMTSSQFGKEAQRNASTATNATAINFSPNTRFRSDSESSASPYGSSIPWGQPQNYDSAGYLSPVKGGKDAIRSRSETSIKTFVSFSRNRNTFLADDDFLAMYATPLQDLKTAYTPSPPPSGSQSLNYSEKAAPVHPHGFVTTHFSTNTPSLARTTSKRTRARMGVGFHIETTRPNFQKILERALNRWPDAREVGVFLCGAKAISVQLHKACCCDGE
ncbi:hypothetical protein HDV00_011362 [Rhizophlyctis rosea]|nr:hypothetical protein HDV00_011362 [Rhizophlyctis rosea]